MLVVLCGIQSINIPSKIMYFSVNIPNISYLQFKVHLFMLIKQKSDIINLVNSCKQTEEHIDYNSELGKVNKDIEHSMNKRREIIHDRKNQIRLSQQKTAIVDNEKRNEDLALRSQVYNRQIHCLNKSKETIDHFDKNMENSSGVLDSEFVRRFKLWRVWQSDEINSFLKCILITRFNQKKMRC